MDGGTAPDTEASLKAAWDDLFVRVLAFGRRQGADGLRGHVLKTVEELSAQRDALVPSQVAPAAVAAGVPKLTIDFDRKTLSVDDGQPRRIYGKVAELLGILNEAPGTVFAYDRLIARLYPAGISTDPNNMIRVLVRRARVSLSTTPLDVHSRYSVGYELAPRLLVRRHAAASQPTSVRERIIALADGTRTAQEVATAVGCELSYVYYCKNELGLNFKDGRIGRRTRDEVPAVKRRFEKHFEADPENVNGLQAGHPALREMRTIFTSTVVDADDSERLLVSGANHRKIGDRVIKGAWSGFPIFVLTLEERATCPASCHMLDTCYGNGMPRARRHRHGPELEARLEVELAAKQAEHPNGFVVRLHALGDFYSVIYARKWNEWLDKFPALHCFGYTAWGIDTPIGKQIAAMRDGRWKRFAIRTSGEESHPAGATTIWVKPEHSVIEAGLVCPAQLHPKGPDAAAATCCGSCGLCWAGPAKKETIAFIAHGGLGRGRRGAAVTDLEPEMLPPAAPTPAPRELADRPRAVLAPAPPAVARPAIAPRPQPAPVKPAVPTKIKTVDVPASRIFTRTVTTSGAVEPRMSGKPTTPPTPYVAPPGWNADKMFDFSQCWRDGMRVVEMMKRFGISSSDEVHRRAKQFKLPDRSVFTAEHA